MTIKDLEYLAAIEAEGSITAAARKLFVAQPALSQCVHKVEKEYEIQLFVRTASGVQPTDLGVCFLEKAHRILKEHDELKRQLSDIKDGGFGHIRIGIPRTQSEYVLPYVLPEFKRRFPNIQIEMTEASSEELEKMIVEGKVDVGILHPPIMDVRLRSFEISKDRFVILPRSNSDYERYSYYKDGEQYPYMSLDFFNEEPLATTPAFQRSRMICDAIFKAAGVTPKLCQISRNLSTLEALVRVDYASTIMPEKQIKLKAELRQRGQMEYGYYLIDDRYHIPYVFVASVPEGSYLSKATLAFISLAEELKYTF